MKVKEVMSVRTYYVTMETMNGDFQYRTDWTGNWEFLNGSFWETIDDTEELQKTLTEYWGKPEMTNKEIAQELLQVLSNSQHHNPAWALKEVLEKLRELISGTNENVNWRDECNVSYVNGYDDCLKSIDDVCDELEVL